MIDLENGENVELNIKAVPFGEFVLKKIYHFKISSILHNIMTNLVSDYHQFGG